MIREGPNVRHGVGAIAKADKLCISHLMLDNNMAYSFEVYFVCACVVITVWIESATPHLRQSGAASAQKSWGTCSAPSARAACTGRAGKAVYDSRCKAIQKNGPGAEVGALNVNRTWVRGWVDVGGCGCVKEERERGGGAEGGIGNSALAYPFSPQVCKGRWMLKSKGLPFLQDDAFQATKVQQAKAEKAKARGLTQTTSALGQAFSFKKKGGASSF
eukprot:scaffold19336_cov16-Tisochrysis_lutea.AAC.3